MNGFHDVDNLSDSMGASPDGLGYAPVPMRGFGADALQPQMVENTGSLKRTLVAIHAVASLAGGAVGVYHGYKRNDDSVGWALGWGFFGSLLPLIAVPLMFGQGLGKEKRARR